MEKNINKSIELADGDLEQVSGGYYDDFKKKGTYMTNPRYQDTYYCTCGVINKFVDIFTNSKACSWCSPVGGPCSPHICGNCSNWSHC